MGKYLSWKRRGKDGGKGFVLTWKPKKQIDRCTWVKNLRHLYEVSSAVQDVKVSGDPGDPGKFTHRSFAGEEDSRARD